MLKKLFPFFYLIVIGVLARLLPHPPNITPTAAIALFAGATITSSFAVFLPLCIMICSDFIIGFHSSILFVYGSFILITFLGKQIHRDKNIKSLFVSSLFASLIFFIITNTGAWATFDMYPRTFKGLCDAYIMGLPFLRYALLGDLFYTITIFYSYKLSVLFVRKLKHTCIHA